VSENDQKSDERDTEIATLAARVDVLEASVQDLAGLIGELSPQRGDSRD